MSLSAYFRSSKGEACSFVGDQSSVDELRKAAEAVVDAALCIGAAGSAGGVVSEETRQFLIDAVYERPECTAKLFDGSLLQFSTC